MPEPVSKQQIDQGTAGWDALVPGDVTFLLGHSRPRTDLVKGLRDLADFLEKRLDVPVDKHHEDARVKVYADGSLEQMRAQVEYAAQLTGGDLDDQTPDGGHYRVVREFGPVTYELIGVNARKPETAFAPGDEVRLTLSAATLAANTRLARAGYVIACEEDPVEGRDLYTVHFPGRAGNQDGWWPTSLCRVTFEPVELPSGNRVTSMQAAEELLIELTAGLRVAKIRRQPADESLQADRAALAEGLASACGLEPSELLEQIQPRVSEHVSEQLACRERTQRGGAQLAASDRPPETNQVSGIPPQPGEPKPPVTPVASTRGKKR